MSDEHPHQFTTTDPIPDDKLKYLVLGAFRMVPFMQPFPLLVREVIDNFDEKGTIQSFTIVTASGLRYTVRVDFDGNADDEGTQP